MGAVLGRPKVLVNRYYDPGTGQFLSIDPDAVETEQPYVGFGDDSFNSTDPLGLCSGPDGICTNQATGQMNLNSSRDPSDRSTTSPTVQRENYTAPGRPTYQPTAEEEFMAFLFAEGPSVGQYFERMAAASNIPKPATANNGSNTQVPSQVMANQTYEQQRNSVLACGVGVGFGAAGAAGGAQRLAAGLGREYEDSEHAEGAFSNPPGIGEQLEQDGEGVEGAAADDAGPTDGLSVSLVVVGLGYITVGGIFSAVLASNC
jgi:hypothetical protein